MCRNVVTIYANASPHNYRLLIKLEYDCTSAWRHSPGNTFLTTVTICLKDVLGSSKGRYKILRTHNKPLQRQEHSTEDSRSIKRYSFSCSGVFLLLRVCSDDYFRLCDSRVYVRYLRYIHNKGTDRK